MARRVAYGRPANARELRDLDSAVSEVFNFPAGRYRRWIRAIGGDSARAIRRDGKVVGGLVLFPIGQWFGGRKVSMTGIAAVAVLPEARALGSAGEMMRECAREIAASGTALSGLYPATQPVYRRAGWEGAGSRIYFQARCDALETRERGLTVRRGSARDLPALRRLYAEMARSASGLLVRTPYMWKRRLGRAEDKHEVYLFLRGRTPEGYCILFRDKREGPLHQIEVLDFAFATPAAGRRLLAFLASHRSMVKKVGWTGGPADALASLLREQDFEVQRQQVWMLRITGLRRAVEERGYPAGMSAEVHLEVEDGLVAGNAGLWVLRVAGGRGRLVRGGRGSVRATISALAPVYSGFRAPGEQRALGGIDGPAKDLAALGAVFAGPAPWNREMY